MSRIFRIQLTASLAAAALMLLSPGVAQGQQDWPLRCHLRTSSIQFGGHGFLMNFRGAAAASRDKEPGEGECAWEDRGWRSDEPMLLSFVTEGEYATMLGSDGQLMSLIGVNSNPPVAERQAMTRVAQAWRTGGLITFYVVNDGRAMKVTRIGS